MAINITMPALSPTMEEGKLARWLVKEGDSVSSGDVVAEIETDKATMEVESIDEGIVARLVVAAGVERVKVNTVIAVLAEEGEDVKNVVESFRASASEMANVPEVVSAPEIPALQDMEEKKKITEFPSPSRSRVETVLEKKTEKERIFASPLARRIARDKGIDLSIIKGSGPHGRIIRRDIENVEASSISPSVNLMAKQSDTQILKMFAEDSYDLKPHDSMRKIIAERLTQSKQTVPHFYLSIDCNIDALLGIRAEMNEVASIVDGVPSYKISVNDMVIKALSLSLRDLPEANVSWTEASMIYHRHCDVGVAVSIPGGLITPIVRKAEEKSLSAIANEMRDLASRARERKLKPHEYKGGSTAVSNLGMFGIKNFSAVINPPQSTILAVGAGEKRAIVKNGDIVSATMMSVTLSTDHRAVDGALGAQLLGTFKKYIEFPAGMLV